MVIAAPSPALPTMAASAAVARNGLIDTPVTPIRAASQRPFRPADPWHRTGDLGRLDADGWLWFTGRAAHKQLIKTGGENVYPAEVEQVLLEHPAVAEAFVFGTPDEHWGEAVHATCALKPGALVTEAELIGFVGQRLARYKRPQRVRFMPAPLERTARAATAAG